MAARRISTMEHREGKFSARTGNRDWDRRAHGRGEVPIRGFEMGRIVNGLVMAEMAEMEKRIDDDKDEGIEIDELSGEVLHVGGSWNIVWDLQSTHSTRTARQCYAVHIGMPGNLTPTLLSNYQKISHLWHQFLHKGNTMKAWGKRKRVVGDEGENSKQ